MPQGKRNERVGTRGGKRAHQPFKPREVTPRRKKALDKARLNEETLAQRIQREAIDTERRLAQEALETAEATRAALASRAARRDAARARLRAQWSLGQARSLVRQGYTPENVSRRTGWPVQSVEDADKIFD